jgi:hypothetical protein
MSVWEQLGEDLLLRTRHLIIRVWRGSFNSSYRYGRSLRSGFDWNIELTHNESGPFLRDRLADPTLSIEQAQQEAVAYTVLHAEKEADKWMQYAEEMRSVQNKAL